jgi:hypothetical protein
VSASLSFVGGAMVGPGGAAYQQTSHGRTRRCLVV